MYKYNLNNRYQKYPYVFIQIVMNYEKQNHQFNNYYFVIIRK